MKSKMITAMSIIMLVGLMFLGYFIIPIGIPICGIIGLTYGIKTKDKSFTKWSFAALLLGVCWGQRIFPAGKLSFKHIA